MHGILESGELSDDIKAKLYNQGFIRVQNINKGTEMQPRCSKTGARSRSRDSGYNNDKAHKEEKES